MPIMWDLGSGDPESNEVQAEGYLKHDAEAFPGIDLVCNLTDLDKHIVDNSVDKFRCSHILEHFGTRQVDQILLMLHKLLKPGGELEIISPNFAWHAELVTEGKDEEAVYYAFGGQLDDFDVHKTGFTPKLMKTKLMRAGFKIENFEDGTSFIVIARKDA